MATLVIRKMQLELHPLSKLEIKTITNYWGRNETTGIMITVGKNVKFYKHFEKNDSLNLRPHEFRGLVIS